MENSSLICAETDESYWNGSLPLNRLLSNRYPPEEIDYIIDNIDRPLIGLDLSLDSAS